jgi:predicted O-methyltransferase YrrM
MRSEHCLELGTAYGMSTLFILAALKAYAKSGRVDTVEKQQLFFDVASDTLKPYGTMVTCHLGDTHELLPRLASSLGQIDFLFHDAGHSGLDHLQDFDAVIDILAPGAIVLIDDIHWDDPRFDAQPVGAYKGWLALIRRPRVRRAVEVDAELGLLLV